jgi:hypothetical protein
MHRLPAVPPPTDGDLVGLAETVIEDGTLQVPFRKMSLDGDDHLGRDEPAIPSGGSPW